MPRLLFAVLAALALAGGAYAQDVIKHPDDSAPLERRWEWAQSRAQCDDGCWIGYGIRRMMEAGSFTGWFPGRQGKIPTLQALVYGREVEPTPSEKRGSDSGALVQKELAILFQIRGSQVREVQLSNISLPVDLEGLPLVWLGRADQAQSLRLVVDQFRRWNDSELKEELVATAGMHDEEEVKMPFLKDVLAGREHEEVREQAVFWIAEAKHADVLPLLERTAKTDRSEEVREQAIFGISRIETDAADDLLIELARNLKGQEEREEAIFWLGQRASKRAAEALGDIAENDADVEMQKKAVFALSQLPTEEGLPRLIEIARTHRSAEVRHEAIFWLGESGDPRAVDTLVEIVRGK